MHLSITHKLLLAIASVTLVTLAASLLLARWSFSQGFVEYINEVEQARLEDTARTLATIYATYGRWPERYEHPLLEEIERSTSDGLRRPPPPPPHRYPPPGHRPPRPGYAQKQGRDDPAAPHRRGPPGSGVGPMRPTQVLIEQQHRYGATLPSTETLLQADIIIAGERLGEVRSTRRTVLTNPLETAFASRQNVAFLWIAIVSLLVGILVAMLMARSLLAPVHRLQHAIARLSEGDFDVHLESHQRDELGRLSRDVNQLAVSLQANRTARQRWMADISHELRTPVSILTAEIEALQDGVRSWNTDSLGSLNDEVARINQLIEDLYQLALADVGALRYHMQSIDLGALLEATLRRLPPPADIAIHTQYDAVLCHGDTQRLSQLFSNLLSNSYAYTDAPGQLHITLTKAADRAVVSFEDSAPGISTDDAEQLFAPLYRAEQSRNRKSGGAGLGLAICRAIVDAHQGRISAASAAIGGIHIRVELPLS